VSIICKTRALQPHNSRPQSRHNPLCESFKNDSTAQSRSQPPTLRLRGNFKTFRDWSFVPRDRNRFFKFTVTHPPARHPAPNQGGTQSRTAIRSVANHQPQDGGRRPRPGKLERNFQNIIGEATLLSLESRRTVLVVGRDAARASPLGMSCNRPDPTMPPLHRGKRPSKATPPSRTQTQCQTPRQTAFVNGRSKPHIRRVKAR